MNVSQNLYLMQIENLSSYINGNLSLENSMLAPKPLEA
jgi:hypothetical protein